jgi:sigma-B regulation protein RsbU (phosphoserine phosphatase)
VLADVSGHGDEVSTTAQLLHELMREHINTWDQTDFVRKLNQSFRGCITRGRYASAAILGLLRHTGEMAFTSAGHLPPLWYRSKTNSWQWLDERACEGTCGVEGLPIGLIPGTTYRQTLIQLELGDTLILYTDGITEAQDGFGDMLGRDRLMKWASMAPVDNPPATGQFLLNRLNDFRKNNHTDDETVIVIQRGNPS